MKTNIKHAIGAALCFLIRGGGGVFAARSQTVSKAVILMILLAGNILPAHAHFTEEMTAWMISCMDAAKEYEYYKGRTEVWQEAFEIVQKWSPPRPAADPALKWVTEINAALLGRQIEDGLGKKREAREKALDLCSVD